MSNSHKHQVAVIGGGNFGTCLALHLARCDHYVQLWDRDPELTQQMATNRRHPKTLTEFELCKNIYPTSSQDDIDFQNLHSLVIAIPTQYIRSTLATFKDKIRPGTFIVCASKGIEIDSGAFPGQIIQETLGKDISSYKVSLSGPSFAIEVAKKLPTAVSIASETREHAVEVQKIFHSPFFRAYTSTDPMGLEICGALKNVMAIASGACHGLGFESNSSAALMTRSLAEITRFGTKLGADMQTFMSLGGVGDLFLTCSSQKSRNFQVGYQIAKGDSLEKALKKAGSVAEGVSTVVPAFKLAQNLNVRAPITTAVYNVLKKGHNVQDELKTLVNRSADSEFSSYSD